MSNPNQVALPPATLRPDAPEIETPGGVSGFNTTLNPEMEDTVYLGFGVSTYYYEDEGLMGAPVAAKKGEGRTAIFRIHGGQVRKVVTWVAQCIETVPIVPHPDTQNPNEVLIKKAIGIPQEGHDPDGAKIYTLVGQYVYLLQKPLADSDPRYAGTSPFSTRTSAIRELRVTDFTRGLIAPSTPPAGYNLTTVGY